MSHFSVSLAWGLLFILGPLFVVESSISEPEVEIGKEKIE